MNIFKQKHIIYKETLISLSPQPSFNVHIEGTQGPLGIEHIECIRGEYHVVGGSDPRLWSQLPPLFPLLPACYSGTNPPNCPTRREDQWCMRRGGAWIFSPSCIVNRSRPESSISCKDDISRPPSVSSLPHLIGSSCRTPPTRQPTP